MNYPNYNMNFADPMHHPNNFGFMGSMNAAFNGMNSLMKMQKVDNYQNMMNFDMIPPTMESKPRRPIGILPRNHPYHYESDSDEESKGHANRKDEESFLNPYSSMIRRKEPGVMMSMNMDPDNSGREMDSQFHNMFSNQRMGDRQPDNRMDKRVLPRMPKY